MTNAVKEFVDSKNRDAIPQFVSEHISAAEVSCFMFVVDKVFNSVFINI